MRTFFNILGPLCNPARVRRQIVGAFSPLVAELMAGILANLDAEHVITLHADDGLDEISLAAATKAFEHQTGQPPSPRPFTIQPEDHRIERTPLTALQGGDAEENAGILRALFDGTPGPHRDVVVLNAAYALHTSGRFDGLDACLDAARQSLDSGAAAASLARLVEASNSAPAD